MCRRLNPLHKFLSRLRTPLFLPSCQLLRIPLPLLTLNHDHRTTTNNKLMTKHVILMRLPANHQRRLLGRPWTLTCYGVGVTAVTDLPSASDPSPPLVPGDHLVLLLTMEPRSL